MNAPKKIWYDPYHFEAGLEKLSQHDTQYIRADLVDGLVEALGAIKEHVSGDKNPNWQDWYSVYFARGRIANTVDAALKRLGEE
jgi:hypothetical protein